MTIYESALYLQVRPASETPAENLERLTRELVEHVNRGAR